MRRIRQDFDINVYNKALLKALSLCKVNSNDVKKIYNDASHSIKGLLPALCAMSFFSIMFYAILLQELLYKDFISKLKTEFNYFHTFDSSMILILVCFVFTFFTIILIIGVTRCRKIKKVIRENYKGTFLLL